MNTSVSRSVSTLYNDLRLCTCILRTLAYSKLHFLGIFRHIPLIIVIITLTFILFNEMFMIDLEKFYDRKESSLKKVNGFLKISYVPL